MICNQIDEIPPKRLDKPHDIMYNAKEEAHPIIRAWIGQLLKSRELAKMLERFPEEKLDLTLYADRGRAVLSPKIAVRRS